VFRRRNFDDDWEDETEELIDDSDDEFDVDEKELDEPTVECPHCRESIHEDAQRCPYCGNYVSEEDRPPPRPPWWIALGVVVCLYLIYRWIVGA
jgi:hypothetical protein